MTFTNRAITALSIAAVALFASCGGAASKSSADSYVHAAVRKGSIERTVSASGTIEPVSKVSVLAQMSGVAERVYVDYNDQVRTGQVLVVLNTDTLKLRRLQQVAAVTKARANWEMKKLDWENQQRLAEKGLVSEYELKTAKANLDVQAAELAAAQAALDEIDTELNQYAVIKSPIDGIVLDRNVEVGENVVEGSSSNASAIFTLAEDLVHLRIEAMVDEVDIASIRKGQAVRFTVEALSDQTFSGTVDMIRLVPQTSSGVVSYPVIVDVENRDGALLPGMTAELTFIVETSGDVLLVPNAALRYQPANLDAQTIEDMLFEARIANLGEAERAAALARRESAKQAAQGAAGTGGTGSALGGLVMSGPPPGMRPGAQRAGQNAAAAERGAEQAFKTLWYLDEKGKLAVIAVRAGVSDGTNTSVEGVGLREGLRIIVREQVQ